MKDIVFVDVDTQFDFMDHRGALYVPRAEDLIPNIKLLTRFAQRSNILIVSTVDKHIKNDPEFKQFPPHCIGGSKGGKKIIESLLRKHVFLPDRILRRSELFRKINGYQQLVSPKNAYSVFMDLNLLRLLKLFRKAFVYGVALDYCVKYAVLGLIPVVREVNLIIDATKPIDAEKGKELITAFKNSGVKIIKTKDVIHL